jgi:PAS domain S-box-containing protein
MPSILLVEDNDDHATLACSALTSSDKTLQIERAASADECIAMLEKKSYDAILLDYSLPKKNGLELLHHIKGIDYDAPVVMITSHGDENIAVEAMKSGAYDYIIKTKGYLDELPLVLRKAIESHELTRERNELQLKIEESENRLRKIFENVEAGIIEIADDCSISYANCRAKQYLSITDEAQPTDICELFSGHGKDKCADCVIRHCFDTGKPANCEIEYDGMYFSVAITAVGEYADSRKLLVAVLMDITNQKKLQQQVTQLERIRVLGRMASGVAHNFNNILAVIMGRTELMLMELEDSEKIEKGLLIIQDAAMKGARTVKRIQEFTGVAKQKEDTKLRINDIVRDAIKMTEPRWKDQTQRDGIKIDLSLSLESNLVITGSDQDLQEALTNMIFNAVDAMPYGGIISIKTYDEAGKVCISVSDTGTGMEPDIIDSIFEPFFTTKGVGHTGLGLSAAYGIVNRHEGEIRVSSTPGKGTSFTIELPTPPETVRKEKDETIISASEKANILVIDDQETIRELLVNILERFGHNVIVAEDGLSGIKAFGGGNFDLVFTDLGMPKISGWEVARRIKEVDPDMMVVLITGWGVELDENELRDRKVDAVIAKPFQINQVLQIVAKALESK